MQLHTPNQTNINYPMHNRNPPNHDKYLLPPPAHSNSWNLHVAIIGFPNKPLNMLINTLQKLDGK